MLETYSTIAGLESRKILRQIGVPKLLFRTLVLQEISPTGGDLTIGVAN